MLIIIKINKIGFCNNVSVIEDLEGVVIRR